MNPSKLTVQRFNRVLLVTVSTAVFSLGAIAPVFAGYVPPQGGSAPQSGSTINNAVRGSGCSAASTTGLIPFAPRAHIGQTISTQPTFSWFTPESDPYLTEFRVAEYRPDGQLHVIYRTEFESTDNLLSSGISTLSLNDTDVHLSPGQIYRWQVVLVCNPNRPSESLVAEADISVIDSSTELDTALETTTTATERAALYAESSLWYDALGEAVNTDTPDIQVSLLEDLAAIEEQADEAERISETEISYSEHLQQVIDAIQ